MRENKTKSSLARHSVLQGNLLTHTSVCFRFCGSSPISAQGATRVLKLLFKTNKKGTAGGFRCAVRASGGIRVGNGDVYILTRA